MFKTSLYAVAKYGQRHILMWGGLTRYSRKCPDVYEMIISMIDTMPLAPVVMDVALSYATSFNAIALTAACYSYHKLGEDETPHKLIQFTWCVLLILLPAALVFAECSMNNLQSVLWLPSLLARSLR